MFKNVGFSFCLYFVYILEHFVYILFTKCTQNITKMFSKTHKNKTKKPDFIEMFKIKPISMVYHCLFHFKCNKMKINSFYVFLFSSIFNFFITDFAKESAFFAVERAPFFQFVRRISLFELDLRFFGTAIRVR